MFATHTSSKLEVQKTKGKLKDTHLAVYRCAMTQLQRFEDKKHVGERVITITHHILLSCTEADEWRLLQMIFEIIQFSVCKPEMSELIQKVLRKVIKMIKRQSFPLDRSFSKILAEDFLLVIKKTRRRTLQPVCSSYKPWEEGKAHNGEVQETIVAK